MKKMVWSLLAVACMAAGSQVAVAATGPRILAIGDSITQGGTDTPGGYRHNFYQTLAAQNFNFKFVGSYNINPSAALTAAGQTAHDGHGGWTVATDVYSAMNSFNYNIDNWMQNSNPDVVTILGGVNDLLLLQGANGLSASAAATRTANSMDLMLGKIFASKPNVQVFLQNLTATAGSNAWANPTVQLYNNALQNTLVPKYQNLGHNIQLVNQYSNFTTAGGAVDGTHLPDGLHPDQVGYNAMGITLGNAVAPVAKSLNLRAAPIVFDFACAPDNGGTNRKATLNGTAIRDNGCWWQTMTNLVSTDGTASDYGFQVGNVASGFWGSSTSAGFITGKAASMFPVSDAQSFWASQNTTSSFSFKLTGLTVGTKYVLDLFGGHEGGTDVTRYLASGLNSLTGDLLTGNNGSNVLTLSGILPNANGEISVTYSAAPGSNAYYLNAFQINEVAAVPEPTSLGLLAVGALALLRRKSR